MKSIGFQDIAGGAIHIYTTRERISRLERIRRALADLRHTGMIKIFLIDGRKVREIARYGYR